MEPFTAILLIAGRHGVKALVGALAGNRDVGDVAADLFAALSSTESRLDERLAGIEDRLDEVLDQRYTVAFKSGLRTLLDIDPRAQPPARETEIDNARQRFIEASSAARTDFQTALAERYLLLTYLMLGNMPAAERAFGKLDLKATEALFSTHEAARVAREKWNAARIGSDKATLAEKRWHASSSRDMLAKRLLAETPTFAQIVKQEARVSFEPSSKRDHKGYGIVVEYSWQDALPSKRAKALPAVRGSLRLAAAAAAVRAPQVPAVACRVGVVSVDWARVSFGPASSTLTVKIVVRLRQALRRSLNVQLHQGVGDDARPLTPPYELASGKTTLSIAFKDMPISARGDEIKERPVVSFGDSLDDALRFEYQPPPKP